MIVMRTTDICSTSMRISDVDVRGAMTREKADRLRAFAITVWDELCDCGRYILSEEEREISAYESVICVIERVGFYTKRGDIVSYIISSTYTEDGNYISCDAELEYVCLFDADTCDPVDEVNAANYVYDDMIMSDAEQRIADDIARAAREPLFNELKTA